MSWVSLVLRVYIKSSIFALNFFNQIHFKKKLIFVALFCHILFLQFLAPLQYFFFTADLISTSCSMRSFIGESVKIWKFAFFLCPLSHLCPGFANGRTSYGERLSLLVPEISRATGVLAEGTWISWLRSSFPIGVTDDGSKSSSLKASLENCHIPGLAKAAIIFFAIK